MPVEILSMSCLLIPKRNPDTLSQGFWCQQEATKNGATAGSFQLNNEASFACPLTGLPMNGRYRFSALKKSGHVISEKALKEVSTPQLL